MKIGVFDSGVGGLTVVREIEKVMPHADIIYVADSKNVPYGTKPKNELKGYVENIIHFLLKKNVDIVVFACNTATSLLLEELKEKYDVPMMGVIEAGAEMAIACAEKGIGIIATPNTIASKGYDKKIKEVKPDMLINAIACPNLVTVIEQQVSSGIYDMQSIRHEMDRLGGQEIDTLILGCTHYPLIEKEIMEVTDNRYKLVNPAIQVAGKIYVKSSSYPKGNGECFFYTSGDKETFEMQASAIRMKQTEAHLFIHEKEASNI